MSNKQANPGIAEMSRVTGGGGGEAAPSLSPERSTRAHRHDDVLHSVVTTGLLCASAGAMRCFGRLTRVGTIRRRRAT